MSQPNPKFRPNADRSIFLNDLLGPDLLKKLTPEILRLQASSHEPITLYIDSFGGNTFYAAALRGLLRSPNQDGLSCSLITVATGFAASSAADLLVAGNYAIAYQHARVVCHGNRRGDEEITHERALNLARDLAVSNEEFAIQYANDCFERLIFRYCGERTKFAEVRKAQEKPEMEDIECFLHVIANNVAPHLQELLLSAYDQSTKNEELDKFVSGILEADPDYSRLAEFESKLLKAILDFELVKNSGSSWSFRQQGMGPVEEKLNLLIDRHRDYHQNAINRQCFRWHEFFLSSEEQLELTNTSDEDTRNGLLDKVRDRLSPIWFLLVSIGRFLQKGENHLSAEDAYWLGLIDEIYGRDDLLCLREFLELGSEEDDPEPREDILKTNASS